jgi:hypothetical protein
LEFNIYDGHGKDNLPNAARLAIKLHVPFALLADDDAIDGIVRSQGMH